MIIHIFLTFRGHKLYQLRGQAQHNGQGTGYLNNNKFPSQELTRLKQAEGEMKIGMTRLRKESVTASDAMSKIQVIT